MNVYLGHAKGPDNATQPPTRCCLPRPRLPAANNNSVPTSATAPRNRPARPTGRICIFRPAPRPGRRLFAIRGGRSKGLLRAACLACWGSATRGPAATPSSPRLSWARLAGTRAPKSGAAPASQPAGTGRGAWNACAPRPVFEQAVGLPFPLAPPASNNRSQARYTRALRRVSRRVKKRRGTTE